MANLTVRLFGKVREAVHYTVVGAEVEGDIGFVGAPRLRIVVMCFLTMRVVVLGVASPSLFMSLVSSAHLKLAGTGILSMVLRY